MKKWVFLMMLLGGIAAGQSLPATQPRVNVYLPDPPAPATQPLKDPGRAFEVSLVSTFLLPPGLGLIYGPSVGHFRAGEVGRGLLMSSLRLTAIVVPLISSQRAADGEIALRQFQRVTIGSSLVLTTLIAIDLLDASNAIRRFNAKQLRP